MKTSGSSSKSGKSSGEAGYVFCLLLVANLISFWLLFMNRLVTDMVNEPFISFQYEEKLR